MNAGKTNFLPRLNLARVVPLLSVVAAAALSIWLLPDGNGKDFLLLVCGLCIGAAGMRAASVRRFQQP